MAADLQGKRVAILAADGGYIFGRDAQGGYDVPAVLALRNALDDAELDLAGELAALAGPFGPAVRQAVALAERASGLSLHREDLPDGAHP